MINFQELEKVAEFKNGELNWFEGRDINAVYVILVGDEYYIGSSHYTYLRISQHLNELLKGDHHSYKLQEKFNQANGFEVYSLERGISKSELKNVEFDYIKKFNPSLNVILTRGRIRKESEIKSLGDSIKFYIRQSGYTIQDVADIIGVNRVTLTLTLQGNPTYKKLKEIADAIGCDVMDFFKFEAEHQEEQKKENTIPCPHCGKPIEVSLLKKEE